MKNSMKIIEYILICVIAGTGITPLMASIPMCSYTQYKSLDRESIVVDISEAPFSYKKREYASIEDLAKALNSRKSYRLEILKPLFTNREIKDLIKQMEQSGISIHSILIHQNNAPLPKPIKKEEFMKREAN